MHKVIVSGLVYPVHQNNGQRISGPPENWDEKEPSYETNEVYITNLPRDLYEDSLLPLFSSCGVIYKMRLMMCFSGTNRGFVYVLYANQESAVKALKFFARFPLYSGINFDARLIFAHKSSNKRILVMGNIDPGLNINAVAQYCYQATKCCEVFRINYQVRYTKVLVLKYKAHHDAAMARRLLMTRLFDFGEKCYVTWHTKH